MYSTELKIKRLSLGAEAREIHKEERQLKAKGESMKLNSLHSHRLSIVRPAARAAHLAHMFLRGRDCATTEDPITTRTKPSVHDVVQNVVKFGGLNIEKEEIKKQVMVWLDPSLLEVKVEGAQRGLVGASNP